MQPAPAAVLDEPAITRGRGTRRWRRLGWRQVPVVFAATVMIALVLIAITIPWWTPYDPIALAGRRLQPHGLDMGHWQRQGLGVPGWP